MDQITVPLDNVLELRQYTLHPGQRDTLIELFEREFIAPQEAAGAHVIGQFRDLERPDHFVWLRGFSDMPARARALQAFYGGPVWRTHRAAANATMIDSDDVLLLCPVAPGAGFQSVGEHPMPSSGAGGVIVATICRLHAPVDAEFLRFFAQAVQPLVSECGAALLGCFKTLYAANNFPALPVHEGVHACVWFTAFATREDERRHRELLSRSPRWRDQVQVRLREYCVAAPTTLLLAPTARSWLRPASSERAAAGQASIHDFDFLAGEWRVLNRRLQQRALGCQTWDEFPGFMRARLHLDGLVNTDEILFPTLGWSGMTLRTFDRTRRQWAIYWINSREGVLLPPVTGGFAGERGEFYGKDEDAGQAVDVRFIWTRHGRDAARWEQAFSYDGGTWETNWIMELTRA